MRPYDLTSVDMCSRLRGLIRTDTRGSCLLLLDGPHKVKERGTSFLILNSCFLLVWWVHPLRRRDQPGFIPSYHNRIKRGIKQVSHRRLMFGCPHTFGHVEYLSSPSVTRLGVTNNPPIPLHAH